MLLDSGLEFTEDKYLKALYLIGDLLRRRTVQEGIVISKGQIASKVFKHCPFCGSPMMIYDKSGTNSDMLICLICCVEIHVWIGDYKVQKAQVLNPGLLEEQCGIKTNEWKDLDYWKAKVDDLSQAVEDTRIEISENQERETEHKLDKRNTEIIQAIEKAVRSEHQSSLTSLHSYLDQSIVSEIKDISKEERQEISTRVSNDLTGVVQRQVKLVTEEVGSAKKTIVTAIDNLAEMKGLAPVESVEPKINHDEIGEGRNTTQVMTLIHVAIGVAGVSAIASLLSLFL